MEQTNSVGHGPTDIMSEWAAVNAQLEEGADEAVRRAATVEATPDTAARGETDTGHADDEGPALGVSDPGAATAARVLVPVAAVLAALALAWLFLRHRNNR